MLTTEFLNNIMSQDVDPGKFLRIAEKVNKLPTGGVLRQCEVKTN